MPHVPIEILCKIIRLLYASEEQSPAALNPISLSFRAANHVAREVQFKTVTITTYLDISVYQRLAKNADHLLKNTKTLRLVRMLGDEPSDGFERDVISGICDILPFFTGVTSLMLGGFTHLLRCFQDYPSIQSFGYIHMGTFLDRESWDGLATFLTHHQPTSVHIEGCNFDEPSDNNLHLNLWPQVTTLSLIDPHGEMSWMTGIGPVFPSVTSLSLSVGELLPVVSRFASLKHLTLTDPHNGTNYNPLSECKELVAVKVVFEDGPYNKPATSFCKLHESLPPTVTSVEIVGSISPTTFSLLNNFSDIALAHPSMQYFFTLSPASIHEILEPGEWEYQYWEEVEVTSDEWEIHLKGPAPPGPLKEGPDERYQYPFESLTQQNKKTLSTLGCIDNVNIIYTQTPYVEYREDLWLDGRWAYT